MNLKQKACALWVESASALRGFKPMSYKALQAELKREGFSVGSSTLQRWSKEERWEDSLKAKTAHTIKGDVIPLNSKQDIDLVKGSKVLSEKSLKILNTFINEIESKIHAGGSVTLEEAEVMLKTLAISSNIGGKFLELEEKQRENNTLSRQSLESRLEAIDAELEE